MRDLMPDLDPLAILVLAAAVLALPRLSLGARASSGLLVHPREFIPG